MSKTVITTFAVTLSDEQLEKIFRERLEELTRGFWVVEEGDCTPGVTTGIYEEDRYDGHKIAEVSDPNYTIVVAACRLKRQLEIAKETERKKKCTCVHGHYCPVHPDRRFR